MEEYGYAMRSVSTYVVRQEARGAVKTPFVSASSNSEGYVSGKKPVQVTGRPYDDDDYDDYKKHGFPTEAYPMKADDANKGYGGNGSYDSKERYKPTSIPTRNGKYDGANKGYGGFGNSNNKERYKPTSSKYDGYKNGANKGHGGRGNHGDKEEYKRTSDPPRNDNYGKLGGAMDPKRIIPGGLDKPKLGTTGTTAASRKGIPLSEAINDIEKVIGLLKEVAINDHSNNGGRKTTDTALPHVDSGNYPRKHDGVDRSDPRNNWAASLGNDPRHGEPRGKFDRRPIIDSRLAEKKLGGTRI